MDDFERYLAVQLEDSEFREEYIAHQPAYAIIQALIEARMESGLTQKELSEISGIAQSDISKLENGNGNPSIRTLQRLAKAMKKRLRIQFLDESSASLCVCSSRVSSYISTNLIEHSASVAQRAKVIKISSSANYRYHGDTSLMEG